MRVHVVKQRNRDQVYLLRCRGQLSIWKDRQSGIRHARKYGHRNGVYRLKPVSLERARVLMSKKQVQVCQAPLWSSPVAPWPGGRHRIGYVTDLMPPRRNAVTQKPTALFVAQTPDGDVAWSMRKPLSWDEAKTLGLLI